MTRLVLSLLGLFCLASVISAQAAVPPTPKHLAQQIKTQSQTIDAKREAQFRQAKKRLNGLLSNAREQLAPIKQRAKQLGKQRQSLTQQLEDLPVKLNQLNNQLKQLTFEMRRAAAHLKAYNQNTYLAAQFPEGSKALNKILQQSRPATADDISSLMQQYHHTLLQAGRVVTFHAPIAGALPKSTQENITRIGPFAAIAPSAYLTYRPDTGLKKAETQPRANVMAKAQQLINANEGLHPIYIPLPNSKIIQQTPWTTFQWWLDHHTVLGHIITALAVIAAFFLIFALLVITSRQFIKILEAHRPQLLLSYKRLRKRFVVSFITFLVLAFPALIVLYHVINAPTTGKEKADRTHPIVLVSMPAITGVKQTTKTDQGGGGTQNHPLPEPPAIPGMELPKAAPIVLPQVPLASTMPNIDIKPSFTPSHVTGAAFGGFASSGAGGGGGGGKGTGYGTGEGAGTQGQLLIPLSTARPQIPKLACRRGIQGYAIAEYSVNPNGHVSNIRIIDAQPRGIFENAMVQSLTHWVYQSWQGSQPYRVTFKFEFRLKDCQLNWSAS